MNSHSPGSGGQNPFTEFVDSTFSPTSITRGSPAKLPHVPLTISELQQVFKTLDRKKIKHTLRVNHWPANHDVRKTLWLNLCKQMHREGSSIYKEATKDVFGDRDSHAEVSMPSFVDPSNMLHYHLNEKGIHKVKKIMCVIGHTNPDITFGPGIFPLTSLLLHYLDEEDAYNSIYTMLRSKDNYLAQTKISYEASKFMLKDLTKKHMKPVFQYISKRGMVVEGVLENWLWWIFLDLPFSYMVRVVDCYIFEGPKVLYRVALAILKLFYKHQVRSSPSKSGMDLNTCIKQFCEDIPVTYEELLKVAFGIRGLARSSIQKYFVKNEMYVRSLRNASTMPHMTKSVSCESLNLRVSRSFGSISDNVTESDNGKSRGRSHSHGVIPFTTVGSTLLSLADWHAIWGWLPRRIALYQPKLIYTTAEHGTSLKTFYSLVEDNEPTLIIIKTGNSQVIGAYCSNDWLDRLQKDKSLSYFGTGETFIFTLSPQQKKYSWVGITQGQDIPNSAHAFLAGDNTKFTIGGGNGQGLTLDDNLHQGLTQHCDTFNNEPLVEGEYFTCSSMEVFTFIDS